MCVCVLYGIKITWISRWGQEEGAREDTVDVGRRRQHKYLGVMMARSSSSVCLGSGCLHLATSGFLEANSPGIRVAVSLLPKGPEQGEQTGTFPVLLFPRPQPAHHDPEPETTVCNQNVAS